MSIYFGTTDNSGAATSLLGDITGSGSASIPTGTSGNQTVSIPIPAASPQGVVKLILQFEAYAVDPLLDTYLIEIEDYYNPGQNLILETGLLADILAVPNTNSTNDYSTKLYAYRGFGTNFKLTIFTTNATGEIKFLAYCSNFMGLMVADTFEIQLNRIVRELFHIPTTRNAADLLNDIFDLLDTGTGSGQQLNLEATQLNVLSTLANILSGQSSLNQQTTQLSIDSRLITANATLGNISTGVAATNTNLVDIRRALPIVGAQTNQTYVTAATVALTKVAVDAVLAGALAANLIMDVQYGTEIAGLVAFAVIRWQ